MDRRKELLKKSLFLVLALLAGIGIGYFLYKGNSPSKGRDLNLGIRHHISQPWYPEDLEFAGEKVPLFIPDVRERLERELLINTYWESNTMRMMKLGSRWLPLLDSVLESEGVPSDFKYLPIVESRLSNEISPKGAAGFWHLMPSTAKELGLIVNREMDQRYSPLQSTRAAAKYLKRAKEIFGSWSMAALSYNRGMNGLRRAINHQRQDNAYDLKLNDESARYLFRILAFKILFENPKKLGFYLKKENLYQLPGYSVEVVDRPVDWVSFAKVKELNYKLLRIWNPWIQNKRFDNLAGKGIEIWILKDPVFAGQVQEWDSIPSPVDTLEFSWDPWQDSLFLDRVE